MQSVSSFLAKNPSVNEILQYVETEAQRIAAEKRSGSNAAK